MKMTEFEEISFSFNPDEQRAWRHGEIRSAWHKLYPDLFDDDDLRVADNQPAYHFGEWAAAIYLLKDGWHSLIEQYIYKNHPRKIAILKKIIGEKGIHFLANAMAQPPDLFVYRPDYSDFFFGEVKLPGDKLRANQLEFFRLIDEYFQKPVKIILPVPHL